LLAILKAASPIRFPYSEILECDESWVFGYVKCRSYVFPWGKLYFVRGYANDSLLGWDKNTISSICKKAEFPVLNRAKTSLLDIR